ncbi:cytidine deaminase-like protein [Xylariomycetidae sp. FL2044]|nr:cytidine deaminase-like protein [Xylariomycetidae sp. FL2044]
MVGPTARYATVAYISKSMRGFVLIERKGNKPCALLIIAIVAISSHTYKQGTVQHTYNQGNYLTTPDCLPNVEKKMSTEHENTTTTPTITTTPYPDMDDRDQKGLLLATEQAALGFREGGIPIGAALVSAAGEVLGQGRNMRVQKGDPILHGEISTLQNTGRLPSAAYRGSTMYTTLSPCDMCVGACLLYGVSRVVIGENRTFLGGEAYLEQRGVEVVVADSDACREMMEDFIRMKPEVWNEDIGVEERVYSKEGLQRPAES